MAGLTVDFWYERTGDVGCVVEDAKPDFGRKCSHGSKALESNMTKLQRSHVSLVDTSTNRTRKMSPPTDLEQVVKEEIKYVSSAIVSSH